MDDEERLDRLRKVVKRQPLHREILFRLLERAEMRVTLKELEDYAASLPSFREATQPQYYLIQYLVEGGGLTEIELTTEGEVVTAEDKEGLTEDEIDDLVATLAYETTFTGRQLVREMQPSARMTALTREYPGWDEALLATLDFLREKHSLLEVDAFLRTISRPPQADTRLQPSAFIDRLEKAGTIAWQGGWMVTDEGRRFVEAIIE